MVGHRDAYLYVQEIAKNEVELSEYVIKNIHSLVLMNRPEDKGRYRNVPVRIMGAYTEPVFPYMIEPKMKELLLTIIPYRHLKINKGIVNTFLINEYHN